MSVATRAGTSVYEQGPEVVAAQRLAIGSLKRGDLVEFVGPDGSGDILSVSDVTTRGDGCDSQAPLSRAVVRVDRSSSGLPVGRDLTLVGDDSTLGYEGFVTVGLPRVGLGRRGYGELHRPELVDPQTGKRFYGSEVDIVAVARGGKALGLRDIEASVRPSDTHQRTVDLASELFDRVISGRLPKSTVATSISESHYSISATLQARGGQWIMAQVFSGGDAVKVSAARTRQKAADTSTPLTMSEIHRGGEGMVTATTTRYGLDSLAMQPDRESAVSILRGLGFSISEIRVLTLPTIRVRDGATTLSDPSDLFAVIARDMRGGRSNTPREGEDPLLGWVTAAVDQDQGLIEADFRTGHRLVAIHPEAALRRFLERRSLVHSLTKRLIVRD